MDIKLLLTMDDLIPKLLSFPPVPAPAQPLSDFMYDQSIRAISQLLISTPPGKLASGLSTGEDVLDVSHETRNDLFI
jgi:COP9 signalosome complex subunit 3